MGEDVDYFNNSTCVTSLINDQSLPPSNDDTQLTWTLMITSWHVAVTSFIVNNSHTQYYTYLDDQHFDNDTTPLFKPFTTRQGDWVWLWLVHTNGIPSVPVYPSAKGERTLGWVETSSEIVRPVTMATYLLSNRPSNNLWFYTSNVALLWSSCSWKPLTNHHKSQIKGWLFKIFRNSSNERCPGFPEVWDWLIGVSPPCDGLHS